LCKSVDHPELFEDPRFKTRPDRRANYDELNKTFAVFFKEKPRAYWVERLEANDVPHTPVYNMQEVFQDEQIKHMGLEIMIERTDKPNIRTVGFPNEYSDSKNPHPLPPPELGEHNADYLKPLGYRCYHSGKWHIDGEPLKQGFARSLDVTGKGQSNFFDSSGVIEEGRPVARVRAATLRRTIGDHSERLGSSAGNLHVVSAGSQQRPHGALDRCLVVHEQNAATHAHDAADSSPAGAATRGNAIVNCAPPSAQFSTQIRPWAARTSPFAIQRPMPVPDART